MTSPTLVSGAARARLTAQDLRGMYPALVTPFLESGAVDVAALKRLAESLIEKGAQGLVPIGGTGEYTAMSPQERMIAVAATVCAARARVPVVPGVLSPGYQEALRAGVSFMDCGADGLLLVTPFYARPTPAGLRQYFRQYASDSGAPLLLYDIPARTGVVVTPETVAGLVEDQSIIGMKACNTDLVHFEKTAALVGRSIGLLSGDDYLYTSQVALGAHGGILASSVLLPRYWKRIADLAQDGNIGEALVLQRALVPLMDALFAETNPGPLKAALNMVGYDVGDVALPLLAAAGAVRDRLAAEMRALGEHGVDDLVDVQIEDAR